MISISVVCPTYNRHRYIPFLIQQYEKQLYDSSSSELIIFDDSMAAFPFDNINSPNIRYVHDNTRRFMIWEKRNILNKLCRGDTIVCMDDDDFYFPDRLTHAKEVLDTNPTVLLAGCSSLYIYDLKRSALFLFSLRNNKQLLNGSFAYRKELLKTSVYKSNRAHSNFNEERSFTNGFRVKSVPLDIGSTTVCISHDANTVPKEGFCHSNAEISSDILDPYIRDFDMLYTVNPTVYWINMDASTERRGHMETQLGAFKFHQRVASVPTYGKVIMNRASSAEEASCLSSHLKAIDTFVHYGKGEWCVVCEDDVDLRGMDLFHERIFYYVKSAPVNWQILQLHVIHPTKSWLQPSLLRWVRWKPEHYSTLIYVIRRGGGEVVLNKAIHARVGPKTKWIADYFLYKHAMTYSIDIPFFTDKTSLGSTIHPANLAMHAHNHDLIEDQLQVSSKTYPFV